MIILTWANARSMKHVCTGLDVYQRLCPPFHQERAKSLQDLLVCAVVTALFILPLLLWRVLRDNGFFWPWTLRRHPVFRDFHS